MSRRQTLTDLLTADKAKADKSVTVDMADVAETATAEEVKIEV